MARCRRISRCFYPQKASTEHVINQPAILFLAWKLRGSCVPPRAELRATIMDIDAMMDSTDDEVAKLRKKRSRRLTVSHENARKMLQGEESPMLGSYNSVSSAPVRAPTWPLAALHVRRAGCVSRSWNRRVGKFDISAGTKI